MLGWDQETYMPSKGIAHRARIQALLSGLAHEKATADTFKALLEKVEAEAGQLEPTSEIGANLALWRRQMDLAARLPKSLVEEQSQAISLGQAAWAKAREQGRFQDFAPHLQRLMEISYRIGELWSDGKAPYDALLDQHERGIRSADVDQLFANLRPQVSELAKQAVAFSEANAPNEEEMRGDCPKEKQIQLNREVAEAIGFDFEAGRIDETAHPFCSGFGPGDVRLTTRYDEGDFLSSLFGVLHEAGHGLYEQGLPEKHWGTPIGEAVSLGIHESQSRLWENHVGRSRAFWERWFDRASELFPHLRKFSLDRFLLGVNRANFSFIRVEADEATYDLHIMLRFEIEKLLFNGSLKVEALPEAWNDLFASSFGMTPPSDRLGCLQDIHWSMGGFGYFPTYTLGNLNSAQLFAAAQREDAIQNGTRQGNYAPLLSWLRTHVHEIGSQLSPAQIMLHATGATTEIEPYIEHLRRRFLPLG